ncbi:MAG: helicase HerA-like domain-containing protein [Rhodospirillales bacterium]|jgi:DNA helicase HerA-like ATPase
MAEPALLIGKGEDAALLRLAMANRHGLIAGATGTGKTVTLRVMAELLSETGVPVFMADIKGDLSGIARAGEANEKFAARAAELGAADFEFASSPVLFWDVFGEAGHPLRATISEMGPLMLARLLDLNEIQTGVLNIVFKVADDEGLLLVDLKDLRALLAHVSQNAADYAAKYGNVSPASVGAIQRGLLALETQGGDKFFGEPAVAIGDLLSVDAKGRGLISILAADRLMQRPLLYATFLLWLLSELYENLPEAGDLAKPKLAFFFDEAHLLFADAPKALIERIELVVRLIRSKGVGVYFCTQNALDLPDNVLGQLGNRVQHGLRAFSPRDQKTLRATAETFRARAGLDTAKALQELSVGEAIVSLLDEKGSPVPAMRARICPPRSRLVPLSDGERRAHNDRSALFGKYEDATDRVSAYEQIAQAKEAQAKPTGGIGEALGSILGGGTRSASGSGAGRGRPQKSVGEQVAGAIVRSVASSVGRQIGTAIVRGVLGSILKR